MLKKIFLRVVLAAVTALGINSPAFAVDFRLGGDSSLRCIVTMTGQIIPGDADKLTKFLNALPSSGVPEINGIKIKEIIRSNDWGRICLNSPGGSLAEAVKMADVLLDLQLDAYWINNLGTAVPAGNRCESACSIFFMAGGEETEGDIGRVANRVLHAKGRLGFHSISLQLPERAYSSAEVSKAFKLALQSMGAVADRMAGLRLRLSLLQTMLSTPPDEMYYVDTIGDAAHWNILIEGLPRLRKFSPANIMDACRKMSKLYTSEDGITAWGHRNFDESGDESLVGWMNSGHYWSNPITKEQFDQYSVNVEEEYLKFVSDDGTDLGDIGCDGRYQMTDGSMGASVTATNGWYVDLPNYWMFPSDVTFSTLLAKADGLNEIDPDVLLINDEFRKGSRCRVFKGHTKLDDEPCQLFAEKRLTADLSASVIMSFTWPSGGKTVVENTANSYRINGVKADSLYGSEIPKEMDIWKSDCLRNQASGNTFCFSTD